MKKNEIKTGETYLAKVSGKLVRVKVNEIVEQNRYGGKSVTRYQCINTATGREIVVKSAARFRSVAPLKLSGGQIQIGETEL